MVRVGLASGLFVLWFAAWFAAYSQVDAATPTASGYGVTGPVTSDASN